MEPATAQGNMLEPLELSSAEKRSWIRRIPPEVWIFLFYFLVTVFLTWPLIIRFGSSIYGVPSDNMGALYNFWWIRNFHLYGASYWSCPMIGFPFGARFFALPMEPVAFYFEWFLLLFLNEIVVYNFITITNFVLAGITMYYLVRYLTGNRQVAFFGGFALMISTYLAFNSMFFLNLAMVQWMPLFILMLLRYIKKPDWKSAMLLVLSGLLVAGTSVHYAVFMAVFTAAFLIGRLAAKRLSLWREARRQGSTERTSWNVNKKTMVLSLLVLLILIILVTPFYYLPLFQVNPPGKWPTTPTPGELRIEEYIEWNSARPIDYITPSIDNPTLGRITRELKLTRGSFTNALYIGWVLIILALIGVFSAMKRRGKKKEPVSGEQETTRENQSIITSASGADENHYITWGLLLTAVVAFVLSLQPYVHIGSTKIPLPSYLLMVIVPWFRWYMRLSILVIICLVILACFGLSGVLSKLKRSYKAILLVSLTLILTFEMLIVPPFRNVDMRKEPRVFKELAGFPEDTAIAFYPLRETGIFITSTLMYYQKWFQKPMLNGAPDNSDGEALRRTVYNPYSEATPGILRRFNINYVVFFREQMSMPKDKKGATKLPTGLELAQRIEEKGKFDNADIYRITAPRASFVPIYLGNITVPQLDEGVTTARLMANEGTIRILNFSGKDTRVSLELPISNNVIGREVIIKSGDETIWQRKMSANTETVSVMPDVAIPRKGKDLHIIARGPVLRLPDDEIVQFGTLIASIRLGDLKITKR